MSIQLDLKINQLAKELQQNRIKHENDLQDLKSKYETSLKKLREKGFHSDLNLESTRAENLSLQNNCTALKLQNNELEKKVKSVEDASRKCGLDAYNMKVEFSNWKFKYKCVQDEISLLKSRALNMESHIQLLIAENEQLKTVNKHHDCVVDQFKNDETKIKKESELKLNGKQNEINSLSETISQKNLTIEKLKCDQSQIECQVIKLTEEINYEKERRAELKDQLEKSHQLISSKSVALTESLNKISQLESTLQALELENDSINQKANDCKNLLNDQKISHELQIEDLKVQMNKLNVCLSKESEEKSQSNEQVDSLKEQLYLNQLSLRETINELKKERTKKGYDNFTQTVDTSDPKTCSNKMVQTVREEPRYRPAVSTQTNRSILCAVYTQTDRTLGKDQPSLDFGRTTSSRPFNESSEESDGNEVRGIYTDQLKSLKQSKNLGPTKKNIFDSTKSNGTDSARVFKNNLNSYLSSYNIRKNAQSETGDAVFHTKNRDVYKGNENLLALDDISRKTTSKSKSVKRVKFSETKFEYDEQI